MLVAEGGFDDFTNTAHRADHLAGFQWHEDDLAVVGAGQLAEGFDVFLRDEVVDRLHVTAGDGFGNHACGFSFRLGCSLACLGFEERGLALAFGLEDIALLLSFGGEDGRLRAGLRLRESARA